MCQQTQAPLRIMCNLHASHMNTRDTHVFTRMVGSAALDASLRRRSRGLGPSLRGLRQLRVEGEEALEAAGAADVASRGKGLVEYTAGTILDLCCWPTRAFREPRCIDAGRARGFIMFEIPNSVVSVFQQDSANLCGQQFIKCQTMCAPHARSGDGISRAVLI